MRIYNLAQTTQSDVRSMLVCVSVLSVLPPKSQFFKHYVHSRAQNYNASLKLRKT